MTWNSEKQAVSIPVDIRLIQSLLSRAESMVLLENGCVQSNNVTIDEFLTALGVEVRDRLLKVFKDKAAEERIMLNFRASCCKLVIQSLEK